MWTDLGTEIAEVFAGGSTWDAMLVEDARRRFEDAARARSPRDRRVPKAEACPCGRALVQSQVGRPVKYCSRKCREAGWRAKAAS